MKRKISSPTEVSASDGRTAASQTRAGSLVVATYNVNGVNGRLPRLLEWLHETRPDVVCLQELKTDDTRFPVKAIHDAGYGALWHGQRAHHGVAILAKGEVPQERRRGLTGEASDPQTRYLEAEAKASLSRPSICPTATRYLRRTSTTNCSGSNASSTMRKSSTRRASPSCLPVTLM